MGVFAKKVNDSLWEVMYLFYDFQFWFELPFDGSLLEAPNIPYSL